MQKIEPYTKWAAKDGRRVLHVNSVGWRGDQETAWGLAFGRDDGPFEMSFDEIRSGYTFAERF